MLIKCKDCDKEMSNQAWRCPNCGCGNTMNFPIVLFLILMASISVALMFFGNLIQQGQIRF